MKYLSQTKLSALYPQINAIKSKAPFYTNLFTYTNIPYRVKSTPSTLLLLKEEKHCVRAYFFSNDLAELESLITALEHDKNLCIEILQKQPESPKISFETLQPQALYTHLRKTLPLPTPKPSNPMRPCRFPTIHPKTLQKILFHDFKPDFDHLPSLKTLQHHHKNGHILSIREQNIIHSYVVFRPAGKSAYLNFIANHGDKQSLLEIWRLFYQKLNALEVRFLHLWCDTLNQKALNMYQKENFSPDGLKNYIYIKLANTNGGGGIARIFIDFLIAFVIFFSFNPRILKPLSQPARKMSR
ncbi:hypothetical protein [Helicobacter sp. 11S02596-1]|uniref:hypothetical protein n=1 Tax=Helicobacter sp. 11S02596-1 TaxID=1476194 RepID=UPI000BA7A368|nr:hypothetical protein [Helicobacter sp. 11S02596-1]PAF45173.1 hypothetical protein BJI48_01000 [Helicobacter sp. 11S02596-1]